MISTGTVIRAAAGGHADLRAVGRRRPRPRSPPTSSRRPGERCPARCGSPSCIRPTSSRLCQVASTRLAGPGNGAPAIACCPDARWPAGGGQPRGPHRGPARAEPSRAPLSSRRAASASGRPRWTSISSAIRREHLQVAADRRAPPARHRTVPGRPSQFTKVPGFSATAATGNTTSARSVTALTRSSRLTTKPAVLQRGQRRVAGRAGRPGRPRRPAAPRCSPPAARRGCCPVSRPGSAGSEPTPQARATSARAASSVTRRPPGSRTGSAPASIAPRSPARRGIQASRAPVASASRDGRGQRARYLGQPLARPGSPRPAGASAGAAAAKASPAAGAAARPAGQLAG